MSLLLGEGPIRRRFLRRRREKRRLKGSPREPVKLAVRVKRADVDGIRVTYVATSEIDREDWVRLVKEGKDMEFIRKVGEELAKMDFTIKWFP